MASREAFHEVADALAFVERHKLAEQVTAQILGVDAQHAVVELAPTRYRGGSTNYLAVIDAERTCSSLNRRESVCARPNPTIFVFVQCVPMRRHLGE